MKLGHLVEYKKTTAILQSHAENEAGRIVPDLFLFFRS